MQKMEKRRAKSQGLDLTKKEPSGVSQGEATFLQYISMRVQHDPDISNHLVQQ